MPGREGVYNWWQLTSQSDHPFGGNSEWGSQEGMEWNVGEKWGETITKESSHKNSSVKNGIMSNGMCHKTNRSSEYTKNYF